MSQSARACYQVSMHAPASPGLIEPEVLLLAYRNGIFPMSDARDDPEVFWIEPRIRAVLPLDAFHLSRSLKRTLRRDAFTVTCNRAFPEVLEQCAAPRDDENDSSWISYRIQASYENLHRMGTAHSIECWQDGQLAGGLYGVGFDRVFCGESMFSLATDASKVALAWLVAAMRHGGAELLDCQFMTEHLKSLGADDMSQENYVARLHYAQRAYSSSESPFSLPEAFDSLLDEAAADTSPGNFIVQFLTQTS